jgi:flap endonuclease-1
MGVQLGDIVLKKNIEISDLVGRKIAVDAFNTLYQFLSIIRQPDGTPLQDRRGRITSHLSGILYRNGKLLERGVLPCYVFDGEPPALKAKTHAKRAKIKEEAMGKWQKALMDGLEDEARMFAQQTSRLTESMVEDSKKLLDAMGIPWVQAPSEGESQAAHMAANRKVWATGSQDYDSLLFGSPQMVKNLNLTGRRKVPRKNMYVNVEPELFVLTDILGHLDINQRQLIDIGIMIGTDYNEGIRGIGPKKALAAIRSGKSARDMYKEMNVKPEVDIGELREMFLHPKVTNKYSLEWKTTDKERMIKLLVDEHDFSLERVQSVADKMLKRQDESNQSRLDTWSK